MRAYFEVKNYKWEIVVKTKGLFGKSRQKKIFVEENLYKSGFVIEEEDLKLAIEAFKNITEEDFRNRDFNQLEIVSMKNIDFNYVVTKVKDMSINEVMEKLTIEEFKTEFGLTNLLDKIGNPCYNKL